MTCSSCSLSHYVLGLVLLYSLNESIHGEQIWRCRSATPDDIYVDKRCRDNCIENQCESYCVCNMTDVSDSCSKLDFAPDKMITISENAAPGTRIFSIDVNDQETWSYTLGRTKTIDGSLWRSLQTYFKLKRFGNEYEMIVDKTPDLENIFINYSVKLQSLKFSMTCSVPGSPEETTELMVLITPVNEFFPQFIGLPLQKTVPENTPIGTVIFSMADVTIDRDVNPSANEISEFRLHKITEKGDTITSRLDSLSYFSMSDIQKGNIAVREKLDYEDLSALKSTQFVLNVSAADIHGLVSFTILKLDVTDTNDLPPEFTHQSCPLHIPRSRPCPVSFEAKIPRGFTGPIQNIIPGAIHARDMDAIGANITLSLERGPGESIVNVAKFSIHKQSGVVTVDSPFFKEIGIDLVIVAKEVSQKGLTTQAPLKVYVTSEGIADGHNIQSTTRSNDSAVSQEKDFALDNFDIFIIAISVLGFFILILALFSIHIMCWIKKQNSFTNRVSPQHSPQLPSFYQHQGINEHPSSPLEQLQTPLRVTDQRKSTPVVANILNVDEERNRSESESQVSSTSRSKRSALLERRSFGDDNNDDDNDDDDDDDDDDGDVVVPIGEGISRNNTNSSHGIQSYYHIARMCQSSEILEPNQIANHITGGSSRSNSVGLSRHESYICYPNTPSRRAGARNLIATPNTANRTRSSSNASFSSTRRTRSFSHAPIGFQQHSNKLALVDNTSTLPRNLSKASSRKRTPLYINTNDQLQQQYVCVQNGQNDIIMMPIHQEFSSQLDISSADFHDDPDTYRIDTLSENIGQPDGGSTTTDKQETRRRSQETQNMRRRSSPNYNNARDSSIIEQHNATGYKAEHSATIDEDNHDSATMSDTDQGTETDDSTTFTIRTPPPSANDDATRPENQISSIKAQRVSFDKSCKDHTNVLSVLPLEQSSGVSEDDVSSKRKLSAKKKRILTNLSKFNGEYSDNVPFETSIPTKKTPSPERYSTTETNNRHLGDAPIKPHHHQDKSSSLTPVNKSSDSVLNETSNQLSRLPALDLPKRRSRVNYDIDSDIERLHDHSSLGQTNKSVNKDEISDSQGATDAITSRNAIRRKKKRRRNLTRTLPEETDNNDADGE